MPTGSARFKLNGADYRKLTIGAIIAMLGAGSVYLLDYFQALPVEAVNTENWYVPLVVSALSVVVNLLRKLASDYS